MSDIKRCKYARDPEDEFCCNCDGITVEDDNHNALPATKCGGYEPEEAVQTESVCETPADACENTVNSCECTEPNKDCIKGVTSVIRAESGVSREINGTWFKFMFSEERILPPGCDIEAEKQDLWDSVNAQVDAQVADVQH